MKTRTRGLFRCPRCDASRAYAHRRIRRFFVFLFVPVLRLTGEKEFVQCGFCRRAYEPSILGSGASEDGVGTNPAPAPPWADRELNGPAAALLLWEVDGE